MISDKKKIAELRVRHEEREITEVFPIFEGYTYIGKDDSCDIKLTDYWISQRHARIEVENDEHFIEDLNSTNRTKIGDKEIRANKFYQISSGKVLYFGRTKADYNIIETSAENLESFTTTTDIANSTPVIERPHGSVIEKIDLPKSPTVKNNISDQVSDSKKRRLSSRRDSGEQQAQITNENEESNQVLGSTTKKEVRIATTGCLITPLIEKSIKGMNGKMTNSMEDCTHLMVGHGRRTFKLLAAIALGKRIVNMNWLEMSKIAGYFVGEEDHLFVDNDLEKEYKFSMKKTIELSLMNGKLLKGKTIWISNKAHPDVKMMRDLVEYSGGTTISKLTDSMETIVIVSESENKKPYQAHIVVSAEWLLTGILRQELNFKNFQLKA